MGTKVKIDIEPINFKIIPRDEKLVLLELERKRQEEERIKKEELERLMAERKKRDEEAQKRFEEEERIRREKKKAQEAEWQRQREEKERLEQERIRAEKERIEQEKRKKREEKERKRREEMERVRKEQEEKKRIEDEEKRKKEEEERLIREEQERIRLEEENRIKMELEKKRLEEERILEAERMKKEEEERKIKEIEDEKKRLKEEEDEKKRIKEEEEEKMRLEEEERLKELENQKKELIEVDKSSPNSPVDSPTTKKSSKKRIDRRKQNLEKRQSQGKEDKTFVEQIEEEEKKIVEEIKEPQQAENIEEVVEQPVKVVEQEIPKEVEDIDEEIHEIEGKKRPSSPTLLHTQRHKNLKIEELIEGDRSSTSSPLLDDILDATKFSETPKSESETPLLETMEKKVDLKQQQQALQQKLLEIVSEMKNIGESERNLIIKRDSVIREFLSTEQTYVGDLHIMEEDYRKHLPQYLTESEMKIIFNGIDEIIEIGDRFLAQLHDVIELPIDEHSTRESSLSSLIIDFSKDFLKYDTFILSYNASTTCIRELKKSNVNFKNFLQTQRQEVIKKTNNRHQELNSFLITPIQRLPRYTLLLRDLLKNTSKMDSIVIYNAINNAMNSIHEVTITINEKKKKIENKQRLQEIIQNNELAIKGLQDKELLKDISKSWIKMKKNFQESSLYLFSDCFIIKYQTTGLFSSKQIINFPLKGSNVTPHEKVKDKNEARFGLNFETKDKTEKIFFNNEQMCEEWIRDLKKSIELYKE